MFSHATMNRAYRLVWCRVRTTWIAVPEFARAMGRSASTVVAGAVLVSGMVGHAVAESPGQYALPTGGQVVSGQVAIAVNDARMDVNQATRSAIVNWNSFNIGSQAQVKFNQPDTSSVVLNRVLGGNGSTILGQMTANGKVFLVDPAGILFAPGARVDVGGLVASSLGISDSSFLSGTYHFEKVGAGGTVKNQGAITAGNGGYVALIAPTVENTGVIVADRGSVGVAAGDSVNLDFDHDGLLSFQVNLPAAAARIDNKGTIVADGGRVVMNVQAKDALLSTVLNNDGIVRARSVEARNGEIWLGGGQSGVVRVSGTLDASGGEHETSGGAVKVLGEKVGLFDHAKIDVSGVGAGGTVMVGGNWQGKGPEQNATATYVGRDATINADAVGTGNGGKVVVWADKLTSFLGNIFSRGGSSGGNGGTVEVSGKQHLSFSGAVDTTAANGKRGTLLLDPTDVNIVTGGTEDLIGTTGGDADANTYAFSESDGVSPSNIDPTTIVSLLNSSDVTIQANNDITVSNDIDASANTASKGLTLTANNAIFLNANITLKQGASSFLTLTSDADASGVGTINILGDRTVTVLDGAINFAGITYGATGGGAESLTLNVGTGTLTMGAIYGSAVPADPTGLTAVTVTNAGTTNFNGAIDLTGALTQTNAATGTTTFANTVNVGSADLKGVAYALNNGFSSGGTTTIANTGTLTKNGTGNISSTGAFNATGNVNLAANITTTNTDLTIGGNLVLAEAATPTLSTGAGAGHILVSGSTDGTAGGAVETLTLNAGTGSLTFTGAVGSGVVDSLTAVTVTNAAATNFNNTVNLTGALTQTNAATGTTTFANTVNVGSADLKGVAYALNNGFSSGGTTTIANTGTLTKNGTGNISSTGAFNATGNVNLAANITTTNTDLTIGGNLVLAEAATPTLSTGAGAGHILVSGSTDGTAGGAVETLTLNAGTGSLTFTGAVGSGVVDSLTAVTVTNAAATNFNNTVNLTGALTQTNAATGTTTFANTVNVGSADLKGVAYALNNGFSSGGTTTIANTGTLTKNGTGNISSTGAFNATGNVNLAANITTTNTDLTIGGNLVLAEAATPTLSTGAGAGHILVSGSTDGTAGGAVETLTLNAGTGSLTFTGAVGSGVVDSLTAVTVTNAAATNFNNTVNLTGALTQTNAATGTTTFANTVNVGSADLKGVAYALNNGFSSGGTTTIANTGTLTKNGTGNISSTGAFNATGNVNLAANITTTNTDLTIGGNLVLAEAATPTLSTGAGAGHILVSGSTDGTAGGAVETLTLNAGTGSLTFTGAVGSGVVDSLTAVTVTNAAATNFNNTVNLTGALTQTNAATGTTTFANTVNVGSADLKGVAYALNNGFSSGGTTTIANTGTLTKNGTGNISSTGAFNATGNVNLAANITTTNTDLTIGGNLVLAEAATPTLSTGAGAGHILVSGSTDGTAGGAVETLTLNAGTGSLTFTGAVGSGVVDSLTAVTVTNAAATNFNNTVNLTGALTQTNAATGTTTFANTVNVGSADLKGVAYALNNGFSSGGTTTIANTGTLTKNGTGNISSTGAFNATGNVNLAANITTTNTDLTIGGNLVLAEAATPTLSTGAGAGHILVSGSTDGTAGGAVETLTLNAGTGSLTFTGAVGSGVVDSLTAVTVTNAAATNFNNTVNLTGALTQTNAATGTTTFANTVNVGSADLKGVAYALNNGFSSGGTTTIANTGTLTKNGTGNISSTGAFNATGNVNLAANITTTNTDLTIGGNLVLAEAATPTLSTGAGAGHILVSGSTDGTAGGAVETLTLNAGTGSLTFTGAVGSGVVDSLTAVTVTNAAATNFNNTVNLTGALTQTNAATGTTTFANTVNVGSADLKGVAYALNNGFSSGGTTTIANTGTLTKNGTGNISSTGAFNATGNVNLAANITTTNTDLTIGGNLVLAEAATPTLSTGAGAGHILVSGSTDGTAGGAVETLTLNAGTGSLTFTGAVGSGVVDSLTAVTVTNAAATNFNNTVNLTGALTQTNAATGTTTFANTVNVGSADLKGVAYALNNGFSSGGTTTIANTGTLTKNGTGNISSTGAFNATGNVNLAANITTTNTDLTIGGNLVLAEAATPTLSTGAGAGHILVSGSTDGTAGGAVETLTLNAGTGSLTFTGAVGSGVVDSLTAVTVTNAAATNFNNTVNLTGALTQTNAATGTTTFANTVNVGSADLKGVAYALNNGFSSGGTTTIANTGTLTKNGTGNISSTGAFNATGNVNLAANITTTNTDLTIGGNLVLAEAATPTLSTGAGAGHILVSGSTDGTAGGAVETLTLNAGTGSLTFTGAVGSGVVDSLTAVTVTNAAATNFNNTVNLTGALTQTNAATGTTTFANTVNVGSADLKGVAYALNNGFSSGGTTTIANTGTLTKNGTGNISSTGAFNATGNVNLAANITTTNTDLTIGGNLVLAEAATPTLSTGAGAGHILVSGSTDGTAGGAVETLTLNAGTGSLTFTGAVGSGVVDSLTAVTVTNAAATNFNNTVNLTGALTQTNAATGTTTFANTVNVGSADLKGVAYALNNGFSSGGTTTIANTGTLTKNGTGNISSTGAFNATGNVNLAANITTTNTDLTIGGNLVLAEAATPTLSTGAGAGHILVSGSTDGTAGGAVETLTLNAGTGSLTFTGAVGSGVVDSLTAVTVTNAAATNFNNTVNLTGALTQTNAATGTTTFANTVNVGSADLKGVAYALNNGFSSGGTTTIANTGTLTKNGTGNISSTGAFNATGNVNLAANITTTNTDLTIGGNLVLAEAATPTLSTGAGAGHILVSGSTDGTAGGAVETLTLNAGTGSLTFTGAVGSGVVDSLTAVTVTNAAATNFNNTVNLTGALTQTNAATGTTTFANTVNVGSADLKGVAYALNNGFSSGGTTTIANTGTLTKNGTGNISSTGAFNATGNVNLAANITTTNTDLTIGGNLVLAEAATPTLSTGAGAGHILVSGSTDGTAGGAVETLTLNAGTGSLTFTGAVGSGVVDSLTAVTVTNAAATNFNNTVNLTGALTQTNAATGTTTFANTVNVGSADLKGVAYALNNGFSSGGTTTIANTGTLTKNGTGNISSTGAFNATGNVNLAANITTTNTDLTIGGNLVLAEAATPTLSTGAGAGHILVSGSTDGTAGGAVETLTLNAGTGSLTFTGAVGSGVVDSLTAVTVTNAAATNFNNTVNLTGALTQTNAATGTTTFANTVNVGSADLKGVAYALNNGFSSGGTTTIANTGTLTKNGTGNISSTGAFNATGNVNLAANITTTNTDLTIGGNLVLAEAATPTLSTGAGAGHILVSGSTDGTAGGAVETLTLNAGTGSLTFTGAVGSGVVDSLTAVTVTNAAATNFNNTVNLTGALTQTNAATGTTTFANTVNVGSADLKGVAYALNNGFSSGGTTTIANTGTLTKNGTGNISSTGAFNATGNVNLAANITTTNTDLTIGGNLVLAEAATPTLSTGAGAGHILVSGSTNGTAGGAAESLTVLAGAGNVTFTGNVGSAAALTNFTLGGASMSVASIGAAGVGISGNVLVNSTGSFLIGSAKIGGYLDVSAGGAVSQSGAWDIGGHFWVMTSSGDITLNNFQNTLGGTVSLIAPLSNGTGGGGNSVSLWADSIKVGTVRPSDTSTANVGITAARVTIKAPSGSAIQADGNQGLITADEPQGTTPALTIIADGVIGNPATASPTSEGLWVKTKGLVKVVTDALSGGTVMLFGDDSFQPKYEFSGDPTKRSVKYNGVEATSAQLTGALDAAYLDIRNQTTEIRESGFAKENASKVLRNGVVTSAGPGQPAIDDSTGQAGMEDCEGGLSGDSLSCL